jgi:mono/diheme cytochrome c family protein
MRRSERWEFRRAILATALLAISGTASAEVDSIARGREFARANCARCHAIERTGDSPFKPAPPFRTLHERYPVENLEEALAEGIVTGHPDMPEFSLAPDQIADFIDFLKSLEK